MSAPAFDDYVQSLAAVSPQQVAAEPEALDLCARTTAALDAARPLDKAKLAELVAADPATVPVLAAVAGFSQERFKTWLQANFGTAGWIMLGRTRAADLVDALARDFALIPLLWADRLIDGLFTQSQLGDFETALHQAAKRLGLV